MVCRLCLQNSSEVIEIFNNKGQELKIAVVIGKHFWFEPKNEDPVSSHICHSCWTKVSDFHDFYKYVEKAQQLLTVEVIVKTEYKLTVSDITVSDITVEDVELASKHELDENIEQYERPFNITSDVLAENNCGVMKFEFPTDLKNQSIVTNEQKEDDQDITEIHDDKGDESDLQLLINDKKEILRNKDTKLKEFSIRNKIESLTEEATTTHKKRGRPRKVATLKNKSDSSEEKAAKLRTYNDDSGSNVMTKEMSEIINRKISEYMQLKCDVCGIEFETFGHVRKHMMSVHDVRPYVKCCEKKFITRAFLYDHIKFHLNPDIYKCEKCCKVFRDKRTFTNHNISIHQSEDSKIYQCPQCPKKFARKHLLQSHKTRQHYEILKYFCTECKRGFPLMSALTSHTALRHGTKCDICSEVVTGQAAFKRHQQKHQRIVEPKVQCDLCGSWHRDKLSLIKHKRWHTYQEQPQVCMFCQKTYPSRRALYNHKYHVHLRNGKYVCNICKKSFEVAKSLKEHMSKHTGLSLYRCPHCSRAFNHMSNMNIHRKRMHPKEFEELRKLRKMNARRKEIIIPDVSDEPKNSDELPSKHELEENTEELYEEPFNITSDVLAEDNYGAIKFEFPPDLKDQSIDIAINEKKKDDEDISAIHDDKGDESDSQLLINDKEFLRNKMSSERNKESLTQKATTSNKGRGQPRKGDVVPLKNKANCNEKKASKLRINNDPSRSNVMTQELSEIVNREISEYMQLKCDVCGIELDTFYDIKNHMMAVHDVRPYVKCCEKKFITRALLYHHIKFHLNPDIYKCEKCHKVFRDKRTFTNHNISIHQSEDSKIYQCPQCPKKFARKHLLQGHKTRQHHEILKYFCTECKRGFPFMSALTSHTALRHGTKCDICSEVVTGQAAFKRHQQKHQCIDEPKVQCDLCGSWHKDKFSLIRHKSWHTYQEQPKVCMFCQKTYPNRRALYSHSHHVHQRNGKYVCNICKKSYIVAKSLKEHMSIHTGLSLYRCPHCSQTFNNDSNMRKHRKRMHPKEFEELRKLRKINSRRKIIIPDISDATQNSGELPSKHELEENIEEQYEEPFNITSDVLAENNCGVMKFEFPPDLKDQSIDIVINENKKDDEDISAIHDDKGDESDLQLLINDKKEFLRNKMSSEWNKVESLTQKATTSNKGRGQPRKGDVVPLKNKANCNEKKASKLRINKDQSGSNVQTKELSEIVNREISEYMQLKCDVCGIELDTFYDIKNHMMSVHDVRPYVKCCGKKFTRRSWLYYHIKFHLNPDIYKCEKCYKVYSDKRSFTNHNISIHQSEESKIYQCPQCPKKFARKHLLQTHKTRQHYQVLKYFCTECKRGYPFMSALTSHTALRHGTKCDICSEIVKGKVAFKRHQQKHQRIVEPEVQSDLCGSWLTDKLSLTRHKSWHTYQEQPHVCMFCQKTYPNRRALYSHKQHVHQRNGKYVCNICKKSYIVAKSLKEHMSKHTGLSLYRCPHCSRTFNHMSNMNIHRKKMHPKEFEELRKLRKMNARRKEIIIPDVSDEPKNSDELPIKHEVEENTEELYEEPFNITSDVLAEDNYGAIKFEFPPDLKDQSIDIVINEKKKDDQDISAIHDDKDDESDLQLLINDKKEFLRNKMPSDRNKVESLTQKATTSNKGREQPGKGDVVPLKNKANCNEKKASKLSFNNDPNGSNVMTQELSEIVNREISEYMQLKCDVCGIELDTFYDIKNHMMSVHDVRPYVKCCGKKFTRRSWLYYHIKFHLNPDIYKCEKCYKVYSDKRSFTNHNISIHQSEDSKIYQCSQCPKKFARKYLLQTHRTRQHYQVLKYFCTECKIGYPFMSALTSHTALRHGTKCDICSEIVKGKVAFKRHQQKHQRIVEPEVQCDLCGSWLKDKLSLTRHKSWHTYQEQPQVCMFCQKTYPNRRALYSHKKHVHQRNGKYVCNICKKSYIVAKSLKEHMSKHTGLSLYRCPHCSRTFNHMSNMNIHRKKMHPKEFEELRKLRKIKARRKIIISDISDATKNSGELPSKHELEENIEEQYEGPFNITSDVSAEDNNGVIEFEFPPDLKDQSIGIVINEKKKDDQDISAIHDDKGDESDLQFLINNKKEILRNKGTKLKKLSIRNKMESLTEEATTTYKGRGRKGEVAPLKNDSNCNEEKAAKLRINNDASGSYVTTQEMPDINRKISEYMLLQCDVCGIELDTFCHIRSHMRLVHDVRPYVKCCEKKFTRRAWLYDHIKFHLNPDIYKCEKCYKVFSDKRTFTNHNIYIHQSEDTKIYQCPRCPKKFARKYLLQTHKTRQHYKVLKYFCPECNRGFPFMSILRTHTALVHGTKCDICSEVVKGQVAFKRHQQKHQRIVEPKVQCDLCGSWQKDKLSLTRHKRWHTYYQEQPQVCNICQKTYPSRAALYNHKHHVHQPNDKFVCNICKKSYKSAMTLKEHMSKHTGVSLYRCLHCSRTFNHMSNMHLHRKRMHPKEFEELRKLRKINARSNERIIPTISSLSDATKNSGEFVPFSSSVLALIKEKHET